MLILRSQILSQFSNVDFGFNTKIGPGKPPFYFNVSLSVGDDEAQVNKNRELLFNSIGLSSNQIAFQKQVHGNSVTYVDKPGLCGESDAMITDKPELGLAISTADCAAIFIYDKDRNVIAGIHSGWKGTAKGITKKTIAILHNEFNCQTKNLIAYISPSISQKNYEVGKEVAELFDKKYLIPKGEKYLLDVARVNYDMLLICSIKKENIQQSGLCTYETKNLLHSYRRDGLRSGRAFGVIAMKEKGRSY